MPKVGVFISWSGNSRGLAEVIHEWLPTALHSIEPWMSDHDIRKGSRFLEEIDRALAECSAGLICLTPENFQSVWVAFEAGALASRVASSKLVIPLLSRIRPPDVSGPLGMFQGSQLTKSDMLKLIKALNDLNSDADRIPERRLAATFEGVWPELERRIPEIEAAAQEAASVPEDSLRRTDSQLLEEILDVSKAVRILVEDRLRVSTSAGSVDPIIDPSQEIRQYSPIASGAVLEGRDGYVALAGHILKASEIWLAGVSLLAVLDQYFANFMEYVARDRIILRFLLLDPDDDLIMRAATRSLYGVTTVDDLKGDIAAAAAQIYQLQGAAQDSGKVQLRYMSNLPSTSIIMTDPTSGNGIAIAEFYPYRASATDRPHIALNERGLPERKWFLFYRDQFLSMWRDSREEASE